MATVAAMLKPNPDIMRDNPLSKIPTLVLDDGLPNGRWFREAGPVCARLEPGFP